MNARSIARSLAGRLTSKAAIVNLAMELLRFVDVDKVNMVQQAFRGITAEDESMDKTKVAAELVKLAKSLVAEDVVTMSVPLLIRIMEYSKEDAETDMDLHEAVERMLEMGGQTLTMDDYDAIVGGASGD